MLAWGKFVRVRPAQRSYPDATRRPEGPVARAHRSQRGAAHDQGHGAARRAGPGTPLARQTSRWRSEDNGTGDKRVAIGVTAVMALTGGALGTAVMAQDAEPVTLT